MRGGRGLAYMALLGAGVVAFLALEKMNPSRSASSDTPAVTEPTGIPGDASMATNSDSLVGSEQSSPPPNRSRKEVLLGRLQAEARQSLVPDPEEKKRDLERWVSQMQEEDFEDLRKVALERTSSADERMLAAYLLSLGRQSSALNSQRKALLEALPRNLPRDQAQQEEALRAMVMDGVIQNEDREGARKTLRTFSAQTDSSFLARRAQSALKAMQSESKLPGESAPEALRKQEDEALQKLLPR